MNRTASPWRWLPTALWAVLAAGAAALLPRLPAEVPLHFTPRGEPGPLAVRGMLLALPLFGLLLDGVLHFAARYPDPTHADTIRGGAAVPLRLALAVALTGLGWASLAAAAGHLERLPTWAMIAAGALIAAGWLTLIAQRAANRS